MTVLVIVDIQISDPKPYKEYIDLITPSVFERGGRYLVRGGNPQALDGDWEPERVVIMEYPDQKSAQAWLNDPEIAHIHQMRRDHTVKCNMVVVDMVSTIDGR